MNESEIAKPVRKIETANTKRKKREELRFPSDFFFSSFLRLVLKLGTRKELVLVLSVEEHAESSKERPRKDEKGVMRYEDEKKRGGWR
jgi:hypothetical protein